MRIKNSFIVMLFCLFAFVIDVNAAQFNCTLNGYTLTYDDSGKLTSAKSRDGSTVNKSLSSYFKPKSASECPTEKEAKISIIDGGRTLYVAKIDEFSSNNSTSDDTKYGNTSNGDQYNNYSPGSTSCGNGLMTGIPEIIPNLTSNAYTLIQIAVPVVLVVVASIDLVKSIASAKEDDIKKAQSGLIKRLITAVIIFFVFVIVKLLISVVADGNSSKILKCTECFIENKCD